MAKSKKRASPSSAAPATLDGNDPPGGGRSDDRDVAQIVTMIAGGDDGRRRHPSGEEDEFLLRQTSILEEFRRQRERREREALLSDYESEALARAVAQSEYERDEASLSRQVAATADAEEEEEMLVAQAIQISEERHATTQTIRAVEEEIVRNVQARSEDRYTGSWDCTACTYTNPPYRPECFVCSRTAPPTVLTFQPMNGEGASSPPSSNAAAGGRAGPPRRFGVEIEVIIPGGRSDGYTLESIARDLSRIGPPDVVFRGYSHETTASGVWKIVTDASLVGTSPRHDLCFEFVSPILQGEDGLVSIRDLLNNVRKIGIASNQSCGYHVHVEASKSSGMTLHALKAISCAFVAFENAFDLILSPPPSPSSSPGGRRGADANRYCGSNRIEFGHMSNQQRYDFCMSRDTTIHQLVHKMSPSRYKKLNITNLIHRERPSTIEFRQHGGIEEIVQAEAWVRFVLRFVQNIVRKVITSTASAMERFLVLPETSTPEDELWTLFDLIDCQGLEQYYVESNRLFMRERRLNNAWQCQTCHRTFQTCRSLSQHRSSTNHS